MPKPQLQLFAIGVFFFFLSLIWVKQLIFLLCLQENCRVAGETDLCDFKCSVVSAAFKELPVMS